MCELSLARMHLQRAPACGVRTRSRACACSYGSLSRLSRRHAGARTRTASSKWSSTPRGTMSLGIILQRPCCSAVAPWSLCVARETHPNRWDSMDKSAPAATRAETVANWQNDAARCTGVQLHAAAGCTALACGMPAVREQGLSGHSRGTLRVLPGLSRGTLRALSRYSRGTLRVLSGSARRDRPVVRLRINDRAVREQELHERWMAVRRRRVQRGAAARRLCNVARTCCATGVRAVCGVRQGLSVRGLG